jgi:hypothetical protein
MKNALRKKKVAVMIVLVSIVLLTIPIGILAYKNAHDEYKAYRAAYEAGIPLRGGFEDMRIMETTREIPLELVYQFECEELPTHRDYQLSPDGFYVAMPITAFREAFSIDFETEHEHVLISHGKAIGQLIFDTNWELSRYYEKTVAGSSGEIAIAKYKRPERGSSPNTIYVYTSDFPLYRLYTGRYHRYFTCDIRYMDDEQVWDVQMWSEDNPSQRLTPIPEFDYSVTRQGSG